MPKLKGRKRREVKIRKWIFSTEQEKQILRKEKEIEKCIFQQVGFLRSFVPENTGVHRLVWWQDYAMNHLIQHFLTQYLLWKPLQPIIMMSWIPWEHVMARCGRFPNTEDHSWDIWHAGGKFILGGSHWNLLSMRGVRSACKLSQPSVHGVTMSISQYSLVLYVWSFKTFRRVWKKLVSNIGADPASVGWKLSLLSDWGRPIMITWLIYFRLSATSGIIWSRWREERKHNWRC